MNWQGLTPNPELLRGLEEQAMGHLTDAEAQALKADAARIEMAADVRAELSLVHTDQAALDELANGHTDELRRALTYKVLELWFQDNDQGEGSINRHKGVVYAKAYERIRATFRNLSATSARSNNTVILYR